MSKVVGFETVIKDGQEYDYKITCCEKAKRRIDFLLKLEKNICELFDHMRPGQDNYIVINPEADFEMNYCPTCGDKLKKEQKHG